MSLSNQFIMEQLSLGYSMPELAEMWGINYSNLNNNFYFPKKTWKYLTPAIEINGKQEPYYHNEWRYGSIPTYNFEELSKEEINFYYDNLKEYN
jgi:hypothetical protein